MPSCSRSDVVLVCYPFSDLSGSKVRPAVVVSVPHASQDIFVVSLTSRTTALLAGEFLLSDWAAAGLNVPIGVKRGLYTVHGGLVAKAIGKLAAADAQSIENSLRGWLGL